MKPRSRSLLMIALLGLVPLAVPAEETAAGAPWQADIDALFAQIDPARDPGCAVGVIHQGDYVLAKGYGLSNLEHGIPITPASVFRIGSVSKQFTAMAVMLLVQKGAIDLDADVHQYLPELMDYGHEVTVRQMMLHTAGMADYDPDVFLLEGKPFRFGNEDYWTTAEFYERVRRVPLRHAPESQWMYSNLGYFLLSQVVERVSGKSLRAFAEAEIFGPLAMKHTFFNDHVIGVVPQRADGYKASATGGYDIYMTNLDYVGDGGVYTNLEDFIAWDRNFYDNQLGNGSTDLVEATLSPRAKVEEEGRDLSHYALGHFVREQNGKTVFFHSGGWVGFNSYYERHLEDQLSVVLFCNGPATDAGELGRVIARRALRGLAEVPASAR